MQLADLGDDVVVITMSKDERDKIAVFCEEEKIKNHTILTDIKYSEFGEKYGFYVKELDLLTRGVVVINKKGRIAHFEYTEDITNQPDFDKVINTVKLLR